MSGHSNYLRDSKESARQSKQKKHVIKKILNIGVPNSCLISMKKQKWRALVDTGAEVSVMSEKMYSRIRNKSGLKSTSYALQGAGGKPLNVLGVTTLSFKLGSKNFTQKFHVISHASRNLILGTDFLSTHKARIYFDLQKIRVGNEYIDLERDIHISSVVRATTDVLIQPNTTVTMLGKVKDNGYYKSGDLVEFSQGDSGWMANEPGLLAINSVSMVEDTLRPAIAIVNTTTKAYKIKRGGVLGLLSVVDNADTKGLAEVLQCKTPDSQKGPDFSDVCVPEELRSQLLPVLQQNSDVFAANPHDVGRTSTVKMTIDTGDHPPVRQRPYRVPLSQQKVVDQAIEDMLAHDVIERSSSAWASPIVLVKKKDGSTRFCVDFRKLNKVTKPLAVPLPIVDDLLAVLGKAVYFSSLDLISGYWQIMMDECDKEKTAFCTSHRGLYQFKVMPFGLMNAPGLFTQLISQVLSGLESFSTGYIDDILCFSESLDDHFKHLEQIFERLREHGLKLKLTKCSFLQSETSYLGFKVTRQGIKPEENKIEAIRQLQPPSSKKEIRSFIGSCSYYRKFLPNFSGVAKPLIDLTRKNTHFKWENVHQAAFDSLKASLTKVPFLAYPDITKPFTLTTDASDYCIGACLSQLNEENVEVPVYFISHKLSATQTRWPTIEKEAYAIFYAVKKLDYILYGAQFTIKTDHQPLIYVLNSPSSNKKIQNWMLQLSPYNCSIEHIKGTDNTIADMLSRVPRLKSDKKEAEQPHSSDEVEIDIPDHTYQVNLLDSNKFAPKQFASYVPVTEQYEGLGLDPGLDMKAEQLADPEIHKIIDQLKKGKAKLKNKFILDNGVLHRLSHPDFDPVLRLYLPQRLRNDVIKQYHDLNGHFGVDKCYHTLARCYYWPNMFQELWQYISSCVRCNTRNLQRVQPLLRETDIPPYPFAKVSLDLAGPFPRTLAGNRYIISFVDWLTGWIEAYAVPDKTADTVVFLLLTEIIPRHSAMLQLVTDNGGENVNKLMKETLQRLNIHHVTTSVFHPQSNSKVERSHRTMNDILSKLMDTKKCDSWDIHLPQALAAMRFSYNDSTGQSPFSLLYGRDAVLPLDNILQPRRKYYGEETHQILLEGQHEAFLRTHRRMKKMKKRQKNYADRTRKDVVFEVGDPVYLKNHQKSCKLSPSWQPYYRIIEQTSPLTFRIKNQLTGAVVSSHAEHLRLAKVEWEVSDHAPQATSRLRVKNVVSDDSSADESDFSDKEDTRDQNNSQVNDLNSVSDELDRSTQPNGMSDANADRTPQSIHQGVNSDSDIDHTSPHSIHQGGESNSMSNADVVEQNQMTSEEDDFFSSVEDTVEDSDEIPQPLPQRFKRVRARSSSEEDIPLAELAKRLRMRANSSHSSLDEKIAD